MIKKEQYRRSIHLTGVDARYLPYEWKNTQQKGIECFFKLPTAEREKILQRAYVFLVRLAAATQTHQTRSITEQMQMAVLSFRKSDAEVLEQFQTNTTMLPIYRRDVSAAIALALSLHDECASETPTLGQDEQLCFNKLKKLEEKSQLIQRRISSPDIQYDLIDFPHIRELLEVYQEYLDLIPYLEELGVACPDYHQPRQALDAFLFGTLRKKDSTGEDGISAIHFWARKALFARWLNLEENFWQEKNSNSRISVFAARLTTRKPIYNIPARQYIFRARSFFTRVLEQEYFRWQQHDERAKIIPPQFQQMQSDGFENADFAGAYEFFAASNAVPSPIIDIFSDIIAGNTYRSIGKTYLNTKDYAEGSTFTWLTAGSHIVERMLLEHQAPTDLSKLFMTNPYNHLKQLKSKLLAIQ